MAYMWKGIEAVIYNWTLVAVSFIFLLIRLYVDIKGIRKVSWYREVMTVSAWIFFMLFVIMYSICNDYNWNNWDTSALMSMTIDQMQYAAKINYVANWMYLPSIYLIKIELLFLYHILAPRAHNPKLFWFIIFAWTQTIFGILAQVFWFLFACPKISDHWTTIPQQTCQATLGQMATIWSFNIWSDLIIYIIPMFIIYRMQKMSIKEKLSAALMFFVGFLNIMGAVFCFAGLLILDVPKFQRGLTMEIAWRWVGVGIFMSVAQQATAVWIVCMPQMKSFWRLIKCPKDTGTSSDVEKNSSDSSDGSPQMSPTGSPSQTQVVREKTGFFKSIRVTSTARSRSSESLPNSPNPPEQSPSGLGSAQ